MANPHVVEKLVCIPETDKEVEVNRFSQSRKWRELLPKDLRVQMVELGSQHYYVHEPVQIDDGDVVVPVFFYQHRSVVMAKCLPLKIVGIQNGYRLEIAEEEDFRSNIYRSIEVSCFVRTWPNIVLGDGPLKGKHLIEVAGHKLWRVYFLPWS